MITVGGMSSLEINPPNHVRIAQTTDRTIPSIFLSQGFAADALSVANARDVNLVSWDRSDKQPTAYQWNVNAQRELPGSGGRRGRLLLQPSRQQLAIDRRQPGASGSGKPQSPAALPDDRRAAARATSLRSPTSRAFRRTAGASTTGSRRRSRSATRRASRCLRRTRGRGLAASKAATRTTPTSTPKCGPTSTDRPHHFVGSGVYELPFGHNRSIGGDWDGLTNALLGGWSVSPSSRRPRERRST